jgi:hypothetical protein
LDWQLLSPPPFQLKVFTIVNVYGPCAGVARENFIAWIFSLHIADDDLWLILGDFNFYRFVEKRNREGGNTTDIAAFNEVISYLGLIELQIIYVGVTCKQIRFLFNWTVFHIYGLDSKILKHACFFF